MKSFSKLSNPKQLQVLYNIYMNSEPNHPQGCDVDDLVHGDDDGLTDVTMDMPAGDLERLLMESQCATPAAIYQVVQGKPDDGDPTYHVVDRAALYEFLRGQHEGPAKSVKNEVPKTPAITPSVGALFETDSIEGVGTVTKTRGLKLTITVSRARKSISSDTAYVATYAGSYGRLSCNGPTWKEAVAKVVAEVRKLTDQWEDSDTETVELYLNRGLPHSAKVISSVTTEPSVAREVDLDVTAFVATTDGALVRVEVSAPTGSMFEGLRKFNQMADRIRTHSLQELKEDSPVELQDGK